MRYALISHKIYTYVINIAHEYRFKCFSPYEFFAVNNIIERSERDSVRLNHLYRNNRDKCTLVCFKKTINENAIPSKNKKEPHLCVYRFL